jgi:hypothetical protein
MERKFAHTRPLSSQNHSSKSRSRKNSMDVVAGANRQGMAKPGFRVCRGGIRGTRKPRNRGDDAVRDCATRVCDA